MSIYDTLNDRQQEAVFYTEGPLLILAGAGGRQKDSQQKIFQFVIHGRTGFIF